MFDVDFGETFSSLTRVQALDNFMFGDSVYLNADG